MNRFLILIHVYAFVVWIGGMFFAHFCLRPVAAAQLPPPQRLPLLSAVLGRFFVVVGVALVLLWGSGVILFAISAVPAPTNWRAMAGIAAVMTVIFLVIVLRDYPRLKIAVAAQNWPAGGAAMNTIRILVLTNLALGFLTTAIAIV